MDARDPTHLRYLSDALRSSPNRAAELVCVTLSAIDGRNKDDSLLVFLEKLHKSLVSGASLEISMKQLEADSSDILEFLHV